MKTGDFNGDGVVDILTLHSEVKVRRCYTPTLYLCQVKDGRVTVKCEFIWLMWGEEIVSVGKFLIYHSFLADEKMDNTSSISLPLVLE